MGYYTDAVCYSGDYLPTLDAAFDGLGAYGSLVGTGMATPRKRMERSPKAPDGARSGATASGAAFPPEGDLRSCGVFRRTCRPNPTTPVWP